jgi:hypothetical protein
MVFELFGIADAATSFPKSNCFADSLLACATVARGYSQQPTARVEEREAQSSKLRAVSATYVKKETVRSLVWALLIAS